MYMIELFLLIGKQTSYAVNALTRINGLEFAQYAVKPHTLGTISDWVCLAPIHYSFAEKGKFRHAYISIVNFPAKQMETFRIYFQHFHFLPAIQIYTYDTAC